MKRLLYLSLLLASCESPKFRYPVVVTAEKAPIYSRLDTAGKQITQALRGDTLELVGVTASGLCQVAPKPGNDRFPGGEKTGYVARQLLQIPDSTLAASKQPGFPRLDLYKGQKPAETNWRDKN